MFRHRLLFDKQDEAEDAADTLFSRACIFARTFKDGESGRYGVGFSTSEKIDAEQRALVLTVFIHCKVYKFNIEGE